MRGFLRFLVGTFFISLFILLLGLSAMRFRLLNPQFWGSILGKAGVYLHLEGKVQESVAGMMSDDKVKELEQLQQSGQLSPQEKDKLDQTLALVNTVSQLDEVLTADKIQELIEENLERISGFIKGKNKRLIVYLPIKDLGLPAELLSQPPLSIMTDQTDVEELLRTSAPEEQVKQTMANLDKIQQIAGYLPLIWIGLLVGAVLALGAHFFLGKDIVKRVKGTSWLLIVSGLTAVIIAVGVKSLATSAINKSSQMPPVLAALLPNLAGQVFNLGQMIGVIVAVIGLGGMVTMAYLVKSGKVKVEKQEQKS